jgi:heme oxygenase
MTLPEYRDLLARLHGFHEPLERGLRDASPGVLLGFDAQACARTPALRADLRALGMGEDEIDALPVCGGLGPVHSKADLMGRLYVVEGSALGGRVMASKLDGILGAGNAEGRRFLSGRSAPDPLPWPALCRLLEAGDARSDTPAVIESAVTTFHALADWLTEGDVHV